jgi:hypothetical protein
VMDILLLLLVLGLIFAGVANLVVHFSSVH